MDASIEKYLQKYAEPEVLKRKKIGHFQQVIVIPSYDEKPDSQIPLYKHPCLHPDEDTRNSGCECTR